MNDITDNQAFLRDCIMQYSDVMEGLIKNATRIDKEMGMFFYANKRGKCIIGDICTGTRCRLKIRRDTSYTVMGSFHVHTNVASIPSRDDIASSYQKYERFMCIGSNIDGIRCYEMIHSKKSKEFYNLFLLLIRSNKAMYDYLHTVANFILRNKLFIEHLYPPRFNVEWFMNYVHKGGDVESYNILYVYTSILDYITSALEYEGRPNDAKSLRKQMKLKIGTSKEITDELNKIRQQHQHELYIEHITRYTQVTQYE